MAHGVTDGTDGTVGTVGTVGITIEIEISSLNMYHLIGKF